MGKLTRPENFGDFTRAQLEEWDAKVRAAAVELAGKDEFSNDDIAYSTELVSWANDNATAFTALADTPADADAARAALASLTAPAATDNTPDGGDDADGEGDGGDADGDADGGTDDSRAVLRSVELLLNNVAERIKSEVPAAPEPPSGGGGGAAPSVAELAGAGVGTDTPEVVNEPVLVAAADFGNYHNGQRLGDLADLSGAVKGRLKGYVQSPGGGRGPVLLNKPTPANLAAGVMTAVPGSGYAPTGRVQSLTEGHQRHGVARIERDSMHLEEFTLNDADANSLIAARAQDEWVRQLRAGRMAAIGGTPRDTLIAAWCAHPESWYTLCEQWSLDGRLVLPTRQIPRGSVQFATGFDFSTVFTAVGDNTATCEELETGVTKTCVELPCLDATTTCLNVDWLCITADLLQRRAWGESLDSFISASLAVKLHKTNSRIINQIASGSGSGTIINSGNDDSAFESFLYGLQVAKIDGQYNSYMSLSGEWEAIVPVWVLEQLRASVMRRRAIDDPVKADSWMQAQFAKIGFTVHFVYGWQDAHVTTPATGLPGGATPIDSLPTEADFIAYPAGTWVLGELPVIELDTIYDTAGLQSNSFTALFVEDGWSALKMCNLSRLYTVAINPFACGCDGPGTTS
jgi:hypothetical protein